MSTSSVNKIAQDLLELSRKLESVRTSSVIGRDSISGDGLYDILSGGDGSVDRYESAASVASQRPESAISGSYGSQRPESAASASVVTQSQRPDSAGSYVGSQFAESNASRLISRSLATRSGVSASQESVSGSGSVRPQSGVSALALSTTIGSARPESFVSKNATSAIGSASAASAGSQRQSTNRSFSRVSALSEVASGPYLSEIEQAVLRSVNPIESNETEDFSVGGISGLLLNKREILNWKGELPIEKYPVNQDINPEIITKRSQQKLEYVQELAIRYLRPPTPPAPGEIIINQEPNTAVPPAPPLIIRQQPARPDTPEPLVVREAPPQPPQQVGRKVITISGKRLPPPPRKVVIERLAPLPSKPQSVIIERWLPYSEVKRRVIFNKAPQTDAITLKPRNVVVQWEAPKVNIRKEFKYLGVVRANPVEYVQRYGPSLVVSNELPQFVQDIATPNGLVLAANHKAKNLYELEGDVDALKLVDLEKEGLGEYRQYLAKLNSLGSSAGSLLLSNGSALAQSSVAASAAGSSLGFGAASGAGLASGFGSGATSFLSTAASSASSQLNTLVEVLFNQIDREGTGAISVEDAEKLVLRLNSRLGRSYGEDDVKAFFSALDLNNDGSLNLEDFKRAFVNLAL